ncbi:hypothetical protein HNY73_007269 [Argiope bruennichi]|uniref:Uncharacterized protein n=1 Tax=Argiope bruennichi TaxID=94029 RepID=A0A8T0FGH5_ARGBR|nr:hypothetical protein HNY73_007269 [Argiope bruennichi]
MEDDTLAPNEKCPESSSENVHKSESETVPSTTDTFASDDEKKSIKKTVSKSNRHSDTNKNEDGFSNPFASEVCIDIKAPRLHIGNWNADCTEDNHVNARKLILNMVSEAITCSSNQIPESFRFPTISTKKSEDNDRSISSDESETSTSTIQCVDNGFETSETEKDDNESTNFNSNNQKAASDDNISDLYPNPFRILEFSDSDSRDSTLNFSDNGKTSSHSNSKFSDSDMESSHSDLKSSDSDMESSHSDLNSAESSHSDLKFSDSDMESSHSDLKFSDSGKKSSHSDLKFSDSDMESSHSDLKFSDSGKRPSHSKLKFLYKAQEFYYANTSNPLEREMYALFREFLDLRRVNKDESPVINHKAAATAEQYSGIDPNFNNNLEESVSSDESDDTEPDVISPNERIQDSGKELRYNMRKLSQYNEFEVTIDYNPASIEHEEASVNSNQTMNVDSEAILDVFKTVVKCYPIKKFEIPPYEYAITESALSATGGKQRDSDANCVINELHLPDSKNHRKTLEGCCSNIDSHTVMVFEVEDCFSENSRIICDSLIKEYLDCALKVKFLFITRVKDVSVEDYESRMSKILTLDDDLGYLSAKLIVTINDWIKQFQEIKHNLQNVAQSKIRSRSMHHMGILRICVFLARILLTFTFGKQFKLEKFEEVRDNNLASANPSQTMAEKKGREENCGKSTGVIDSEMQSESIVAANKSDRTTDKDSETSACDTKATQPGLEKSHKKRRRRRGKSASDTSGTGSLTSTEYGGDKDDSFLDNAFSNWRDMLATRISELESDPIAEIYDDILNSDSDVNLHLTFDRRSNKYVIKDHKGKSASKKKKQRVTFNVGDGNDLDDPEKKEKSVSLKVSRNDPSIRPVIYMADKTTQTDPLPESPNNSKITDAQSNTTLNLSSDNLVIPDLTESNFTLSADETYTEIISDQNDISKKETVLTSSLSSVDESFQNITDDFVRKMKISSERFGESFIKSLKNEKFP